MLVIRRRAGCPHTVGLYHIAPPGSAPFGRPESRPPKLSSFVHGVNSLSEFLALTLFGRMSKVGRLPSGKVALSLPTSVVGAPPTPLPGFPLHFAGVLFIAAVTSTSRRRPGWVSPVPGSAFLTFRSLYAGGFFGTGPQNLRGLPWLRPALPGSAPAWPSRVYDDNAAGFT